MRPSSQPGRQVGMVDPFCRYTTVWPPIWHRPTSLIHLRQWLIGVVSLAVREQEVDEHANDRE